MKIILVTLSIGENYTRDYTSRLIEDVLNTSDLDIYITTDFPNIITNRFGNNQRIFLNTINREDIKLRIKVGNHGDDFNFNLRYLCLEPLMNMKDVVVIFTDCDNSFDWWDREKVEKFLKEKINEGFDFFGPRIDYKWKDFKSEYLKNNQKREGIFWHKIVNYNLNINDTNWDLAPLPAEYLLVFYNKDLKLVRFVEQWKYFYNYLLNKEKSEGTWAEGFEIGVSSYVAGFNGFDIGWNHSIWSKMLVASGYKNGHRGTIFHSTER